MIITSEISACKKTMLLWHEIAEFIKSHKGTKKKTIYKDIFMIKECMVIALKMEGIANDCPCCEFAEVNSVKKPYELGQQCNTCPLKDYWLQDVIEPAKPSRIVDGFWCEWEGSPYSELSTSGDLTKECAETISNYAFEALEYWTAMRDMNIIY